MTLILFIFVLVCAYIPESNCLMHKDSRDLNDYCLQRILPYIPLSSTDKIIKRCLKLTEFFQCLLETKTNPSNKVFREYTIFRFQKYYPKRYDLERGGYLFCKHILPEIIKNFEINDNKIDTCEDQLEYSQCYIPDEYKLLTGNDSANVKLKRIQSLSCDYSVQYYTCLARQFEDCSSTDFPMFYFELAILGPSCLIKHRTFIPKLVQKICLSLLSTPSHYSVLRSSKLLITFVVTFSLALTKVVTSLQSKKD
uniref:Uncharacterized protein n=1 Tax=Biomphalaria glabrata TaxID=6526 RepID=A0A2C9LG84_BIOGL